MARMYSKGSMVMFKRNKKTESPVFTMPEPQPTIHWLKAFSADGDLLHEERLECLGMNISTRDGWVTVTQNDRSIFAFRIRPEWASFVAGVGEE